VEAGRVVRVKGDPRHPLTRGITCGKARRHVDRASDPRRLLRPLERRDGTWRAITWEQALDIMSERLLGIRDEYGSLAVLHHDVSGSEGLLGNLSKRFCNAFGGVTTPEGDVCWGSGYAAQSYDFGEPGMHDWADLENSRCIILWGRDPAVTQVHVLPHIMKARATGARVVSINPAAVHVPGGLDMHLAPRPGTDGALALSMAHQIVEDGMTDTGFLRDHVVGFEAFRDMVREYPPERAARVCDVSAEGIREAARLYGEGRPSAILLGYGLQRYANGGQTVRAIDALAAITGNTGVPGGGASYGHRGWKDVFGDITGKSLARGTRRLPWPRLASAIMDAGDPPIKAIIVTRSNPVNQLAGTRRVIEAFRRVDFVVVVDFYMTCTAQLADLVLPVASLFEQEDVVFNSWNPYIALAPKLVDPPGDARSDASIFCQLARHMGLDRFGPFEPRRHLEEALRPAAPLGITLEALEEGPVRNPRVSPVAWEDRCFSTPSGKYELYSERALAGGLDPLPAYRARSEDPGGALGARFPLHFMTSHRRECLNSQFANFPAGHRGCQGLAVEIHPVAAHARGIHHGDPVRVFNDRGGIAGTAILTPELREDVVRARQGGWHQDGEGVNLLTGEQDSDMGLGVPYFDCLCQVKKAR
jgi:anaerobic selenocysteine-containing dehydrogenase